MQTEKTASLSPNKPMLYPDWTKLPKSRVFNIDFTVPKEAKNLNDVSLMTGLSKEYLKQFVKTEDLRNEVYKDSEGHPTIGIGHNIDADPKYKSGKKISDAKAYDLFAKDLKVKLAEQKELTGGAKLNSGQKEALLDLSFNIGYGNLEKTKLIKLIKNGKAKEAVAELGDCTKAGGKDHPGLCKRRIETVYNFAKNEPNLLALKTMRIILKKGEVVYNKRIKTALHSQKQAIHAAKMAYLVECNKIIEKAKLHFSKHNKSTKKN